MIPKGELVLFNDRKTSWCLRANPAIEVSCQHNDVKIIASCVVPFLTAIPDSGIRFEMFINKLNDFNRAVKLVIGDEVNVLVDVRSNKLSLKAVLKYNGSLPEMVEHYFGVELLVSSSICMHLKCDWTYKTYTSCKFKGSLWSCG